MPEIKGADLVPVDFDPFLNTSIVTFPLTAQQSEVWVESQMGPEASCAFNQCFVLQLQGPLAVGSIQNALDQVVRRHAALCARFDKEGNEQRILPQGEVKLVVEDVSDLGERQRQDAIEQILDREIGEPFDLANGPLLRAKVVREATDSFRLILTVHHIVCDGWSSSVLFSDLAASYAADRFGLEARLPKPMSYQEYVTGTLGRNDAVADEAYWLERLTGELPNLDLPLDRKRPATRSRNGARQTLRIEPDVYKQLKAVGASRGATLFHTLLAAFEVLMFRLSGQNDLIVGIPIAGQSELENGRLIAHCVATLPLRCRIDPNATFTQFLKDLRATFLEGQAHPNVTFGSLLSKLTIERDASRPALVSVVFNIDRIGAAFDFGDLSLKRVETPKRFVTFDLNVNAVDSGRDLLIECDYNSDILEADTIRRWLGHMSTLLGAIVRDAEQTIGRIDILGAEERHHLVSVPAPAAYEVAPLHGLFEARVREAPEAEAVVAGDERLSYRELNARANRLAHALRQKGVRRNDIVGLAVERNADVAIGILAILKAGAAYLPLDPDYPRDRLAFVVDDAKARFVLASSNVSGSLQLENAECLNIATAGTGLPDTDPDAASAPDDLAYVIYTSGSTGKPKGVLVTHANVTRLFSATDPWFAFGPHDSWTLFHSYAFDFSVWELWGALLYGGRLVIVPYWVSRDPAAFRKLLVNERITILNQTPSAFRQLIQVDLAEAPAPYALREIIFGGEALELQSLKPWIERYGDAKPRLVNMYGITETTVHVTYRPITRADLETGRGSVIGRPIPDLYIRLLDERGEPVPTGVPGEIWVGGAGVANGYLNRGELTAQRFVTDPFDPSRSARLYRAGDLARRLPDGDLEFLGRIDAQVKIRGFRIELGEIEAALAACPGVADAAVIAREDTPGDKRLVAYLVGKNAREPNTQNLRIALADFLPAHMIPAQFIIVPALPLNANGKLDKSKLPRPPSNKVQFQDVQRAFTEPRSENEQKIAAVWANVLRLERVGADDNFFVLGGDSILSIQVVANCRRAGILNITTRDLFEHPTVAALARCVDGRAPTAVLPGTRSSGMVALTPIQHWFFEQNFSEQNHWNQAFLFEIPSDLNPHLLEQALTAACAQHDAFRLRFCRDGDRWLATVTDAAEAISVAHHDLSSLPVSTWVEAIQARCASEQKALDIERGPLLRAAIFRLGSGRPGRLLLAVHHLAIDGVSWRILMEDLQTAYDCLHEGSTVEFPERTTTYQTWAAHLSQYARDPSVAAAAQTWQAILAAPLARLPASSSENLEGGANSVSVELTADETTALLQEVPAAYRTQINDVLLTALAMTLQRSTGCGSFLIEVEGHGREDIDHNLDLSRTIGWFTSLFPMCLELVPGAGTEAALKSIKEQIRRVPDRGLTYGLLRYCTEDPAQRANLAYGEQPQLLFNYLGQFDQVTRGSRLFAFAPEPTGPWHAAGGRRTHALEVLAQIRDGKLRADWIFSNNQMARAAIERLATDFVAALRTIISHCRGADAGGRTPSDLPLLALSQAEVDRLWRTYPDFVDAYPLTPMQRLFYVMEQAGSSVGLEQWQFRLEGRLDPALLRAAFEQVIARHSILRTGFVTFESGEPVQVVMPNAILPWREQDWRHLDTNARRSASQRELEQDARTRLDPLRPPLMRVNLLHLADNEWQLLWTTHHLCIDGWSWPRLFNEIAEIYAASSAERPAALKSALGYAHYVGWLARKAPASSAYWKEALAGFAAPTPFALGPLAATSASQAKGPLQSEISVRLSRETTHDLRLLSRSAKITLSTLVQGAWALLLSHYADARDVVFGATFSGRPEQIDGIETIIGPCVTNVPVRAKIIPGESLQVWLARLQAQQLDLNQHQFMPLDAIQGVSEIPWHYRLFDTLLVFQNYQVDAAIGHLGRSLRLVPVQAPEATNYALTIAVSPGEELKLRLIYDACRTDHDAVRAIADDLPAMLAVLGASQPTTTVADVLAHMPAERRGKATAAAHAARTLRLQAATTSAAPKGETEQKLAAIWSELLGRSDIGVDDNFFDAGGHSLLVLRMHRLIESAFGVDLQIVKLLKYPTIRTLAANLNSSDGPEQAVRRAELAAERAFKQRTALAKQRLKAKLG
jgi:amino acid adenylation domain-containing protein/non-ribosomal peptide synthase protein (TIGR01720 family)